MVLQIISVLLCKHVLVECQAPISKKPQLSWQMDEKCYSKTI